MRGIWPVGASFVGVRGGGKGEVVEPSADGGEFFGGGAGGAELGFEVKTGEEAEGGVALGGEVGFGGEGRGGWRRGRIGGEPLALYAVVVPDEGFLPVAFGGLGELDQRDDLWLYPVVRCGVGCQRIHAWLVVLIQHDADEFFAIVGIDYTVGFHNFSFRI